MSAKSYYRGDFWPFAPDRVLEVLWLGLLCFYVTSLIPVLGVVVGHDFFQPLPHALTKRNDLVRTFANWDGEHYLAIVTKGYSYDPQRPSNVAFFPAYPLAAWMLAAATGAAPDLALLLVSHLSLAAAFVVLAAYVRLRAGPDDPPLTPWVLLAFGLFPTTFFWRMAYSESLFLLFVLLVFYGLERRWPLPLLALLVGLTTATRSLGVALLLPFALHLWERTRAAGPFLWRSAVYLPAACWELAAWMLYQHLAFGNAFAFVQTQSNWNMRPPANGLGKLIGLLTLEPLWCIFDPNSPCYWGRHEPNGNPLFSLHVANPVYFLLAVGLTVLGAWRRWLNGREVVFAAGLLLIPYLTRGQEMCMAGLGRHAATVFPVYLVMGHLLRRLPVAAATGLLALSGFLLGVYAALFAAWYRFF